MNTHCNTKLRVLRMALTWTTAYHTILCRLIFFAWIISELYAHVFCCLRVSRDVCVLCLRVNQDVRVFSRVGASVFEIFREHQCQPFEKRCG